MNPIFLITIVAIAIVFFLAFRGIKRNTAFQNIDVNAFAKKMNTSEVAILDVRTPEEFNNGHISGAINIDVKASDFKEKIRSLDKNKSYLVYCRSGVRSVTACNILNESGFSNLSNLLGGYNAWSASRK